MKKRLRKKFGVKEFYRPWFAICAELKEMGEGDQAEFVDRLIKTAESNGLLCNGTIGKTELEVALDTGIVNTDNAERRQQFLAQINSWSEFVKIEVSDLQ